MKKNNKPHSVINLSPDAMESSLSLLRYPGGKNRAVKLLCEFIPEDTAEICSPFFGGGSFELACANAGIKVHGYDFLKPLVEFWQIVANPRYRKELVKIVQSYYPLSKEQFYQLQKEHADFKTKVHRAAAFYVVNRSSFSGSTLSGGMSPGHTRFTQSQIDKLAAFSVGNFSVKYQSFSESIAQHPDCLLYLDPPYLIKNMLYGVKGSTHKGFEHELLVKILKKRGNWVMSYNDSPEIREMYKGYMILTPTWSYGMSANKESKEVLILSHDIAKKNSFLREEAA